jgi:hypothetical protein
MDTDLDSNQQKMQYQKAFLVSENTHQRVKSFCKKRNMKINMWVDSILNDIIDGKIKVGTFVNDDN